MLATVSLSISWKIIKQDFIFVLEAEFAYGHLGTLVLMKANYPGLYGHLGTLVLMKANYPGLYGHLGTLVLMKANYPGLYSLQFSSAVTRFVLYSG